MITGVCLFAVGADCHFCPQTLFLSGFQQLTALSSGELLQVPL